MFGTGVGTKAYTFLTPIFLTEDPTETLKKYIVRGANGPECGLCHQYRNNSVTNVKKHIESKHFPGLVSYTCDLCGKDFATRYSIDKHRPRCPANVNSFS